ncbi:hypothetical protein GIS00_06440 [Nakamurella sp. YIM 132087]|uniref:Uncharacterized protein n=1 Tax=Nakamurella alba TaxID=2665158 RepID=A0A7K1FHI6_9ACTN|nr:hypothetical protein [Nakamurella alba]MTD13582.1 hypothetical protein [Nakamurella alba]
MTTTALIQNDTESNSSDATPAVRSLSVWRRLVAVFALVAAMFGGLATVGAGDAQAYTYNRSGVPGTLDAIAPVWGSYTRVAGAVGTSVTTSAIVVPQYTARRSSAAAGAQTVTKSVNIYRWTGSAWAIYTTTSGYGTISGGYTGVTFGSQTFPVRHAGYYQVRVGFSWGSGSRHLGSWGIAYDRSGDYRCDGTRFCLVGANYLQL